IIFLIPLIYRKWRHCRGQPRLALRLDPSPRRNSEFEMTNPARNGTAALTAVCLSSLMFGLEISSVPVILPTLERELHADFAQMQWVMNAYTLACTTVLVAAGTLGDRFGRKRLFVVGLGLFGLTSLVCGLAD